MIARRSLPNIRFALWIFLAALIPAAAARGQTAAQWTGAAATTSYNDPNNWDIGVVPVDDPNNTYAVTIPGGVTVQFDVGSSSVVTDLTLAAGSTLQIKPGYGLSVLDDASISGFITTSVGAFHADSNRAFFGGTQARLRATSGAAISVAGGAYSSTGLTVRLVTHELFTADGAGSQLTLASLQTIDAGFNDWRNWQWTYHQIEATNDGTIDLSALQRITGPVQSDDRIFIKIDNGGAIDLTSLQTIDSAGSGLVAFNVAGPPIRSRRC